MSAKSTKSAVQRQTGLPSQAAPTPSANSMDAQRRALEIAAMIAATKQPAADMQTNLSEMRGQIGQATQGNGGTRNLAQLLDAEQSRG